MKKLAAPVLFVFIITSCNVIRKSPKTQFTDGFYTQYTNNKKQPVYVNIEDEMLTIYHAKLQDKHRIVDTTQAYQLFQKEMEWDINTRTSFLKYTLDFDFLTIPLKYRPQQKDVPPQLNANLNGGVYLGLRTDKYQVIYEVNPLKKADRIINHYGFSFGVFTGFGYTAMTPTTTSNQISIEYDGIVWTKGLAGIVALNNSTIGLSVGFDNLMDKNRKFWVYEAKPWLGLAFGLNLN